MITFGKIRSRIKLKLGDFWWYALILFCTQRLGDVVNMFIGLWLVPHYVPQAELGAVLPLAQAGSVLGLPLTIILGTFSKFLNLYATRGEYGKVKALLRDACLLTLLIFLGTMAYAGVVMQPVFVRLRVEKGSLGLLIVLSGAVAAAAPIATTALQGLKMFRLVTCVGMIAAPVRLVAMLVCLPIRGLSGYFVGQTLPNLLAMGLSFFGLRHILGRSVRSEPYWKSDSLPMLKYMVPYGLLVCFGVMQMTVEAFVIRHRLPDLESAAYYMISRFAETGAAMGLTMIFVAFPLIAERHERGESSGRLLWHSMGGTLAAGLALALLFYFTGSRILGCFAAWRPYVGFSPYMSVLAMIHAFRLAAHCFFSYEMACSRFRFLFHYGLFLVVEAILLYALTGYRFFEPYVPQAWIASLASFDPCRLKVVMGVMLVFTLLPFCAAVIHALTRRLPAQERNERFNHETHETD